MDSIAPKTSREPAIANFGLKKAAARVAKLAARAKTLPGWMAKPMPQLTKAPRRKGTRKCD